MKKILALTLSLSFAFVLSMVDTSYALHEQTISDVVAGTIVRADGVAFSRHNLGSGGAHVTTSKTTQVCVFCHTPHHGRVDTAPLWNRGNAATSYSLYTSKVTTYNSSDFGELENGISVSAACLSCHDGVTTWDNLINYPGKGTTFDLSGTTSFSGEWGDFTMDGNTTTAMAAGSMMAKNMLKRAVIGTDLTNDHPINIFYSTDGTASLRDTGTIMIDIPDNLGGGFTIGTGSVNPNEELLRSTNYWAVAGFVNSSASIKDLLRKANNNGATNPNLVECSSCHDPHYKNRTNPDIDVTYMTSVASGDNIYTLFAPGGSENPGPDAGLIHATTYDFEDEMKMFMPQDRAMWNEKKVDGLFLRRVGGNSYSGVCLTCHGK